MKNYKKKLEKKLYVLMTGISHKQIIKVPKDESQYKGTEQTPNQYFQNTLLKKKLNCYKKHTY